MTGNIAIVERRQNPVANPLDRLSLSRDLQRLLSSNQVNWTYPVTSTGSFDTEKGLAQNLGFPHPAQVPPLRLSEEQSTELRAAKADIEAAMMPLTVAQLGERLTRLANIMPLGEMDPRMFAMLVQDYHRDLGDLSPWLLDEAISAYCSDAANVFFPKPGQLRGYTLVTLRSVHVLLSRARRLLGEPAPEKRRPAGPVRDMLDALASSLSARPAA